MLEARKLIKLLEDTEEQGVEAYAVLFYYNNRAEQPLASRSLIFQSEAETQLGQNERLKYE